MSAEQASERLREIAEEIMDRHEGPWTSPDFERRAVPGTWGARTEPVQIITKSQRGLDHLATMYLAKQYPTMAIVLIVENADGERVIMHNFHPSKFIFDLPSNRHLNLTTGTLLGITTEQALDLLNKEYQSR